MYLNLADMTLLDGVPNEGSALPANIELNFYTKDDGNSVEFFEFLCRDHSCSAGDNPAVLIPVSQIDHVIEMLQKIKSQQVS